MATRSNPPRNGEGDHGAKRNGGGAGSRRVRHRTLDASDSNICRARQLRRNLTLPEVILRHQLRRRPNGLRFRRQFPFSGYVIDFACLDHRLAIEVDGETHSMGDNPIRDQIRDRRLAEAGFLTLRIAARDVLNNLEAVLTLISTTCANRPLHRSGED